MNGHTFVLKSFVVLAYVENDMTELSQLYQFINYDYLR